MTDEEALRLASAAFTTSDSYFNVSVRQRMENDIRQVQGQHPIGSKYYSDFYKTRSKLFRPKTRTSLRKAEAACASAFFSNEDIVHIEAVDPTDDMQHASAAINKQLIQYRLTETLPWFQLVVGAYQEARTVGVVASLQTWKYETSEGIDQPDIQLLPAENVRIDPAANWMDPANSSPYLIVLLPMYVRDVRARINSEKETKWLPVEDKDLISAANKNNDSIRMQRENGQTDSKEPNTTVSDFTIVWVHLNFVKYEGVDYTYYTLGSEKLLSKPQPTHEKYPHLLKGVRPVVFGKAVLQAHRAYPDSHPTMTKDVQSEINTIANQRIDNVRMAMDKRWFVRRNKSVDVRALVRGGSNSVTFMDDLDDAKVIETNDVTGSSYQEQDRLNLDYDDLAGAFSGSSVASNRRLNETVGGMQLLSGDANQMGEYDLRVFTETWVEPVLKQLLALEQYYETDEVVLAIAGEKARLWQRYGIDAVTDQLLQMNLTLKVNVGTGSTNTFNQLEKLIYGLRSIRELLGERAMARIKDNEILKEIFGKLGYKDGGRFYAEEGDNPEIDALIAQVQELQGMIAQKHPPELIAAQIEEIKARAAGHEAKKVATLVEAVFSAMQTGGQIAMNPTIAPVGDKVMEAAGYVRPQGGQDPNIPVPDTTQDIGVNLPEINQNTSPLQPPVPASPMTGIETQEIEPLA